MKKLNLYQTSEFDELAWPSEPQNLTLLSPALDFFTDFSEIKPLVIDQNMPAVDVQRMMQKAHVRLKIVVNQDLQFQGVISADDISDRRLVQKVASGHERSNLTVSELMISKKNLKALDFDEVRQARIHDVIDALKDWGEQHCLVIDRKTHHIRGMFSASDISRKLHLPIDIQSKSSFYKVFNTNP